MLLWPGPGAGSTVGKAFKLVVSSLLFSGIDQTQPSVSITLALGHTHESLIA